MFLKGFIRKNPQFKNRPIYITGESYAGHYIPMFANYIISKNNTDINLAGLALGNAWVDPFY